MTDSVLATPYLRLRFVAANETLHLGNPREITQQKQVIFLGLLELFQTTTANIGSFKFWKSLIPVWESQKSGR